MSKSIRKESEEVLLQQGFNYEETVARVEEVVAEIESGDLELGEVFDEFAIAVEALLKCQDFLAQKKQKVNLLIETLENETETF